MDDLNTLSANRRSHALSQIELAALLGLSADTISNYENGKCRPPLFTAIGLELIFGRTLAEFFPEVAQVVVERLIPQLNQLSIELEGQDDKASEVKRCLVFAITDQLLRLPPGV